MSLTRMQGHFQMGEVSGSTPAQEHALQSDCALRSTAPRSTASVVSPSLMALHASSAPSNPPRIADNELELAAYIVGRNRINGTLVTDQQIKKLRIGQTIIDKTRQRLPFGRGNIREDYDRMSYEPYLRTQALRMMADEMEDVLFEAMIYGATADDKIHYLNCLPHDFSFRLLNSLLPSEEQHLYEYISQICSLAVARFAMAGNCNEHAQEAQAIGAEDAMVFDEKINQIALLVEPPPDKLDHVWCEVRTRHRPKDKQTLLPEHNVYLPADDDVVVDPWVDGPPVLREDSRYASTKPEEFDVSYFPPIVNELAWEMVAAMANTPQISEKFAEFYLYNQAQLPHPFDFYREPPSISKEYKFRYVNKIENSPKKTRMAPLERLQLEVAAVQVNRAFGLPLSAAMKKENVTRITEKFDKLLKSLEPESGHDSTDSIGSRTLEPMQRD